MLPILGKHICTWTLMYYWTTPNGGYVNLVSDEHLYRLQEAWSNGAVSCMPRGY